MRHVVSERSLAFGAKRTTSGVAEGVVPLRPRIVRDE